MATTLQECQHAQLRCMSSQQLTTLLELSTVAFTSSTADSALFDDEDRLAKFETLSKARRGAFVTTARGDLRAVRSPEEDTVTPELEPEERRPKTLNEGMDDDIRFIFFVIGDVGVGKSCVGTLMRVEEMPVSVSLPLPLSDSSAEMALPDSDPGFVTRYEGNSIPGAVTKIVGNRSSSGEAEGPRKVLEGPIDFKLSPRFDRLLAMTTLSEEDPARVGSVTEDMIGSNSWKQKGT